MKIRNKKTGEIAEASVLNFELVVRYDDGRVEKYPLLFDYSNFEDYEEPKEYWYIDPMVCGIYCTKIKKDEDLYNFNKQIGNYFETEEDAEKAVEKLKAFKRLKDKCFRFYRWNKGSLLKSLPNTIEFACDDTEMWTWEDIQDDLDLLFGGEK